MVTKLKNNNAVKLIGAILLIISLSLTTYGFLVFSIANNTREVEDFRNSHRFVNDFYDLSCKAFKQYTWYESEENIRALYADINNEVIYNIRDYWDEDDKIREVDDETRRAISNFRSNNNDLTSATSFYYYMEYSATGEVHTNVNKDLSKEGI